MAPTPADLRAQALEEFRATASGYFVKHPELRSIALCVSQYWNDEADDAVHGDLVFSTSRTPTWPHACGGEDSEWEGEDSWETERSTTAGPVVGDACFSCHPAFYDAYLRGWDSNGAMVEAFAGYCKEGCDQGMSLDESALPYAIARRTESGAVEIEVVGKLLRPWMDSATALEALPQSGDEEIEALLDLVYAHPEEDGPRHVLADFLQERGDPRGAFIAWDLGGAATAERDALIAENKALWMGPLGAVAAVEAATFARGFPSDLEVCFASLETVERCGDSPAWSTVQSIEFSDPNQGREQGWGRPPLREIQYLSERMSSLRSLRGVRSSGLERLSEIAFPLPIATLQLTLGSDADTERLLRITSLPVLETVEIDADYGYELPTDLPQRLCEEADWRALPAKIRIVAPMATGQRYRMSPVDPRIELAIRTHAGRIEFRSDEKGLLRRAHVHVTEPPAWQQESPGSRLAEAIEPFSNIDELRLTYAEGVSVQPQTLQAIESALRSRNPNAVIER